MKKDNEKRLRLAVFRSNKAISAQIIDDEQGLTLVSASEKDLKNNPKVTKMEKATLIGTILAQKAIKKGLKKVRFDRRSYRYRGRVQSLAEAARKGGLDF
jgi:large subunit ribosomal protein L18